MRVTYLTGERVYLRAMVEADKDVGIAWWPGPFLVNAARAEEWLKEEHKDIYTKHTRRYVIVRVVDDTVVGSVALQDHDHRRGTVVFHMAPTLAEADVLRADALRLVVPWVRDDLELMVLTLICAADETETLAAARELGMEESVRLREFVARPGGRVDRVFMEMLNTPWRVGEGERVEAANEAQAEAEAPHA